MKNTESTVCLNIGAKVKKFITNTKTIFMKRKIKSQLKLNKISVSKLNMQYLHVILGGNIPDPTKQETCQSCETDENSPCTRTTVDLSGQRSADTNC